jgi:hypothetical protein
MTCFDEQGPASLLASRWRETDGSSALDSGFGGAPVMPVPFCPTGPVVDDASPAGTNVE